MINNRQTGRRRGRGGQQQRPQGNSGRQDNGNRIDNRARGNAAQLLEKYKTLARDAQMQGDRVNTEYYLQFADHYFRVLAETRSRFEENRRQNGGAAFDEDDQDFDEDGEPRNATSNGNGNGNGQDRSQDRDRNQDRGQDRERAQDRGQDRDRAQDRGARQSEGNQAGQRDDERPRARGNARANASAAGESAEGQPERANGREVRADRNADQRVSESEDRGHHAADAAPADSHEETAPAPAERPRRGRPRRVVQEEAPVGFEADRLPPSLTISAVVPDKAEKKADVEAEAQADAGAEVEKPRRRRGRPPASETTAAS